MPGLNTDPIAVVTIPGGNGDLPAAQFPSLTRIAVVDLVGPGAANRQHNALEKRTVALAQLVNALIANSNAIDNNYLRRDGSPQKDSTAGLHGDLPMGGFRLTGLPAGSVAGHAVEYAQLVAELALKAPLASPALTGTPTAPTPAANSNSTQIATTDWVKARVLEVSPLPTWEDVVSLTNTVNNGSSSSGAIHYTYQLPLRNGDGQLLSALNVETLNSGGIDFDVDAYAYFTLTLVDASNVPVAVVPLMPAGIVRVIELTGAAPTLHEPGLAVGAHAFLDPARVFYVAQTVGGHIGGVTLALEGLRRGLSQAAAGVYFLRIQYGTGGNFHNVPHSRIRALY